MDRNFRHGNLSDIGSVRQNNEDYAWSGTNDFGNMAGIVCDGLGGYKGGSAASEITVRAFQEKFLKTNFSSFNQEQITLWIGNVIDTARTNISEHILTHEKLLNMATTFVVSIIVNNVSYIYNVGDSRCWFIGSDGKSMQLTTDQNLINHLNAINAPLELYEKYRNNLFAITQFIGARTERKVKAEAIVHHLKKGDYIILTSDGCHNFVSIGDIHESIKFDEDNFLDACNSVIVKALANNSNDNLSIVILGV
ncbi:MAG: protein phosphatase 2C domain-containing protein [Mycoplasma sp.]